MYRHSIKRLLDIVGALVGVFLLSPVMLMTCIAVILSMGWPIFFTQQRPGKDGKIFRLIKFRTMTNKRDPDGELLPDAERLTGVGKFLRVTSLDELPELLNVLRGDMSLVGPRPLLVQYLGLYTPEQNRRHEVRPGITGWAQINGRNALTWEEKFEYDIWYVDNLSFCLDARIILATIRKVFKREGINAEGDATMPTFEGSRPIDPRN